MSFLLQKEMQEKATFIHMCIFAVSPSIASCRIQTQSTTSSTNLQWHTPSINENNMFLQLLPFASLPPRKIANEQLCHAMVFLEV